jgi:phage-related protein
MRKKLFYIREKGMENKLGFRYEKNLSSISRDIKSDQIVTKLYVSDVDSELSKTGLCSIKTAEDNPSKDSFIINFNYYTTKGILDKDMVDADLYGKGEGD